MDESDPVARVVLEQPWNRGYESFVHVSLDDFLRRERTASPHPQLSSDTHLDALVVMSGDFTVYDDNGCDGAGWDVIADVQRLAIPLASFRLAAARSAPGAISVSAELTTMNGKMTFEHGNDIPYETIGRLDTVSGIVHEGGFSRSYQYGTLELQITARKDRNAGMIIGQFIPDSAAAGRLDRDRSFFGVDAAQQYDSCTVCVENVSGVGGESCEGCHLQHKTAVAPLNHSVQPSTREAPSPVTPPLAVPPLESTVRTISKEDILQPHGIAEVCVGCHWVWLEFGEPDYNWCPPMIEFAPAQFGNPSQEDLRTLYAWMLKIMTRPDAQHGCPYYDAKAQP